MTLAVARPAQGLAVCPASFDTNAALAPSLVSALHVLRVSITLFDADERLIFANAHFGYMFRTLPPPRELIGRRYEDLIRLEIAAGDMADAPQSQAADEIERYVAERRAQLFSGDHAPRDITLTDGRIIEIKARRTPDFGWIVLWTDVTAARRNQGQLHAALALTADGFAFYDRGDRLTLCNDEYAAIVGTGVPDDFIGLSFEEVLERAARTGFAKGDPEAYLRRRREMHRRPAGAMTVETGTGTAYLLRDRATKDGGRIVVLTDVTEHRRAEKALTEQTRTLADMREALERSKAHSAVQANYLADLATKLDQTAASADTTKKTLLRTMSHELKTPLNAIIGFSDLLSSLADSAKPDQIREYAGLIHMGGKNLLKLLNQIMDLTKISAGRFELNRQTLDAGMLLWQVKERFESAAEAKQITLSSDGLAPGLMLTADEIVFTALIGHLIENAVNFTQRGGTVRLAAEQRDGKVRITVADNGPGVKTEDLARIVEPFEQGGRSPHDHPDGAGLGLTLVKAYCELHGGTLTLQSAPGAGFTAIVELPAA